MSLVTVDPKYLDFLTMMTLVGTAAIVAALILLVYVLQDKYRTPKQSNNMTKAHRRHIPLILLAGLDHFADLYPITEFIPEVLQSFPFGKGNKKRTYRFVLPQKINVMDEDLQVEKNKDAYITKRYIQALNDLNTEKVFLRGVNSPILAGVKNRSIAASFPFLSALNWTKDIEELIKKPAVIEALKTCKDVDLRNLGEVLQRMSTGVSLVDFHAVYKYVDINWDHTINDSISERDKTDGRLERGEDKEKGTKNMLLYFGFAMCSLAAVIAVIYFFGGK